MADLIEQFEHLVFALYIKALSCDYNICFSGVAILNQAVYTCIKKTCPERFCT